MKVNIFPSNQVELANVYQIDFLVQTTARKPDVSIVNKYDEDTDSFTPYLRMLDFMIPNGHYQLPRGPIRYKNYLEYEKRVKKIQVELIEEYYGVQVVESNPFYLIQGGPLKPLEIKLVGYENYLA